MRGADGDLEAIVEAGDASPEQLEIGEANSSIYVFRGDLLWPALDRLAAGERAGRAVPDRRRARPRRATASSVVVHVADDPGETEGVNTRVELAAAAAALRDRINVAHMLAGVTHRRPARRRGSSRT